MNLDLRKVAGSAALLAETSGAAGAKLVAHRAYGKNGKAASVPGAGQGGENGIQGDERNKGEAGRSYNALS